MSDVVQLFDVDVFAAPSGRVFRAAPLDAAFLELSGWRLIVADELFKRTDLERLAILLKTVRDACAEGVDVMQRLLMTDEVEPPIAPVIPSAPALGAADESRVWETSDDALASYDAAQLVALRADHRADGHDAAGCRVCQIVGRRLGEGQ